MLYAVIDTNVLVSALLKSESIPAQVMEEIFKGNIIPVLNKQIMEEYEDVLSRKKFGFDKAKISILLEELDKCGVYADQASVDEKFSDLKDVVFYAVTMEKRKEDETYLVTGNLKHFPVKYYVVSPREMLEIIGSDMKSPW